MLFVILPVTIIIISFFHKDHKVIQNIANFCAIGGNIFVVGHLASKGLLEEYFHTFFVTIYNTPSLETKVKIFNELFYNKINIYTSSIKDIIDFQEFVQTQVNTNFPSYIKIIKTLSQTDLVPFASKVAEQLYKSYNENLMLLSAKSLSGNMTTTITNSLSQKLGTILGFTLMTFAIGFLGYKTYQKAELLQEAAALLVDSGKRITSNIKSNIETDKAVSVVNDNIANAADSVVKVAKGVQQNQEVYVVLAGIVANNGVNLKK